MFMSNDTSLKYKRNVLSVDVWSWLDYDKNLNNNW